MNKSIWLTKKEAAMHIKVSLRSIEGYIAKGLLKAYHIGGRVLLRQDEIDAAIIASAQSSDTNNRNFTF